MTGHGWRSIFSTWSYENNFPKDHIEFQLSHIIKNKTEGAYNKAQFLPQRAALLQAYANFLMPQAAESQRVAA